MKSTGLFGKNSGRVGGVVYSNYRGQQIVRSYQPQVKNPNTKGQTEQRAKFKLVSQVAATLRDELKRSFVPAKTTETGRNSFVREMLQETTYTNSVATLPIEAIRLTRSTVNAFSEFQATNSIVSGVMVPDFAGDNVNVRVVLLGYNEGGEINILSSSNANIITDSNGRGFNHPITLPVNYSNIRALVYAYKPNDKANLIYEDYEITGNNATLDDIIKMYQKAIDFSETRNVPIPKGV